MDAPGRKILRAVTLVNLLLATMYMTACPGGIESLDWKELGNGYIYHEPSGKPIIEKEDGSKGIPAMIYSYESNNNFIVALVKNVPLSDEQESKLITSGEIWDYLSEKGTPEYWIIKHDSDSIYGPLTPDGYLLKSKELGVPASLKAQD
jgi:hypothetical protein